MPDKTIAPDQSRAQALAKLQRLGQEYDAADKDRATEIALRMAEGMSRKLGAAQQAVADAKSLHDLQGMMQAIDSAASWRTEFDLAMDDVRRTRGRRG